MHPSSSSLFVLWSSYDQFLCFSVIQILLVKFLLVFPSFQGPESLDVLNPFYVCLIPRKFFPELIFLQKLVSSTNSYKYTLLLPPVLRGTKYLLKYRRGKCLQNTLWNLVHYLFTLFHQVSFNGKTQVKTPKVTFEQHLLYQVSNPLDLVKFTNTFLGILDRNNFNTITVTFEVSIN